MKMTLPKLAGLLAAVVAAVVAAFALTRPTGPPTAGDLFEALGVSRPAQQGAPVAFRLADPAGKLFQAADFHGKVVFLNFWTTWCRACVEEMPAMEKLHRRMAGRPFAIVAVNLQESAAAVSRFMEKRGLTFQVLLDRDGGLGRSLGIRRIPTTLILDRRGRIVGSAIGPRDWNGKRSLALFEHLINTRVSELEL